MNLNIYVHEPDHMLGKEKEFVKNRAYMLLPLAAIMLG